MTSTSRVAIVILVSVLGLAVVPASAKGSKKQAVARYKEGRALIEKNQFEDALRELTASYELLDSPNTLLLMAHAQRELGRATKAAELYEQVIADAEDRVAKGERRFKKTAADAKEWLDKLSEKLGKITVSVNGATDGTTVRIDGQPVKATRTSDDTVKVDTIWWKAGPVKVEASNADGASRNVTLEIPRGGAPSVELDLAKSQQVPAPMAKAPAKNEAKDRESSSIPTASWVMGGMSVAGFATFAIFGSMAKTKSADLEACSPRCPESERDVADAGKRDQMAANIGLAVGGVGLAVATGFYIFSSPAEPEAGNVNVGLTPNGVLVRGSF